MDAYQVGAKTAAYHLWNAGLLESKDVRDDLIEKYGSRVA